MPEATQHSETYQRHGDPDPSKWDEQEAVTDRPNDTPLRGVDQPAVPNSTFAERAKKTNAKEVTADQGQNKAVRSTTARARKAK